ncbi:MAG: hypothetical protein ONB07_11735 [candidate division KSB1 bacterium]|nr:hypothetical protein [candidate division KSB1 bacterium]
MYDTTELQTVISVSDMAQRVGLSRQRFTQLVSEGVFPSSVYDVLTRRPFYTAERQERCLEVKRRNVGINGRMVLFYTKRLPAPAPTAKPNNGQTNRHHAERLDGLRGLGLTSVTAAQVEAAVKKLYPKGTKGVDSGDLLRTVFLHFRACN